MSDEDGTDRDPDEWPLAPMSDGALKQARETLENAKSKVGYASDLLTGPLDDVADPRGSANDAKVRIEETIDRIKTEQEKRKLERDENVE